MTLPIDINHGVNLNPPSNHAGNMNGNESAFLRAARATSVTRQQVVTGTLNPASQQPAPLAEPSRINDHQLQQFISGHEMANAARLQHRLNARNSRTEGSVATRSDLPTTFQQVTAMRCTRPAESSSQQMSRDPDPWGIVPRESLFAGAHTTPQTNITSTVDSMG